MSGQGNGARPLKIGLQLPEVEYHARWRDYLEMARIAEAVGLDSLWLGDHLLYRYPGESTRGPWECWSLLSALACDTHGRHSRRDYPRDSCMGMDFNRPGFCVLGQ